MNNDEFKSLIKQSTVTTSDAFVDDLMSVIEQQSDCAQNNTVKIPWIKLGAAFLCAVLSFTLFIVNQFGLQVFDTTPLKIVLPTLVLVFVSYCVYLRMQSQWVSQRKVN